MNNNQEKESNTSNCINIELTMTKARRTSLYFHILAFSCFFLLEQCKSPGQTNSKTMESNHRFTNELIHETSPYLLQHAHNPVYWRAWNDETLALAKKENKPLLISIGYSACHWCHVMEHESFEDEEVAKLMNDHFICVKVDREERPDVDQVYMSAVQLITGSGGWPLNCFALPDGRPFHGGTYFKTLQWKSILKTVHKEFSENPDKLVQFAERLTKGVAEGNIMPQNPNSVDSYLEHLSATVAAWEQSMDHKWGGPNREPKFPIPNNYQFLLKYAFQTKNSKLKDYVELTLDKMAKGGIYDQVGGGFARYSTDKYWKVPHFEKMLYDNAQLLSLYAEAYQSSGRERYKEVIDQTVEFIARELTDESGAFYSALDADSEGEEGKFYVWSKDDLRELFGEEYAFLEDMFILDRFGSWEGNVILMQNLTSDELMVKHHLTKEQVEIKRSQINSRLLQLRAKRIRPGLDDKSLTSWNAMMISGLLDASRATGNKEALKMALANAKFIKKHQMVSGKELWHSYKAGPSSIQGFIEDYAFVINAWLDLYEQTADPAYLNQAAEHTEYTLDAYFDEKQHMFRFNSKEDKQLIVNSIEYQDNVMPSSNSVMANNLHRLFLMTGNTKYRDISDEMNKHIAPLMSRYGSAFSNWAQSMMHTDFPHYEVVVIGKEAEEVKDELNKLYLPHCTVMASKKSSDDHLFEYRYVKGKTLIYICQNNVCQAPIPSSEIKKVIDTIELKIE
jgi:uncharacterized protein